MQIKGIITKFEANKPYTKKDGSQTVVTNIAVKIGELTKYDTYGQPYNRSQIIEVSKFGTMADRFAQLALVPGQEVDVQLDFEQRFGHTEVDIYAINPSYQQPLQQQAPQYAQPAYQQPQQPSVFPNTQAPY